VRGEFEAALKLALTGPYEFDRPPQRREKEILVEHWGDWKACKERLERGHARMLLTLVVGYLMWRYRIPPRGLVAMGGAALYLIFPIDVVPEAILGPLGLVDDAGVVAAVVLFVYKMIKARRILADGGIELGRPRRRSSPEPDRR
jgi:uncharacterized membrane protein YkvA (DUF1232 family)